MKATTLLLALVVATGCNDDEEKSCPVVLVEQDVIIDRIVTTTGDPVVQGHILRGDGVSIDEVYVAGVPADNKGDDFRQFSATVPAARLANTLKVEIESNCGFLSVDPMNPAPPVTIGTLADLPATVSTEIPISVTAGASDIGSTVTISTTLGTLETAASVSRVFVSDGHDGAVANTSLTIVPPVAPGIATITAVSNGKSDVRMLKVVRAPLLTPAMTTVTAATMVPLELMVVGSANATMCFATAPESFAVTFGGDNIIGEPHSAANGLEAIKVEVKTGSVPGEMAIVTCRDALGQTTTSTVMYAAPAK